MKAVATLAAVAVIAIAAAAGLSGPARVASAAQTPCVPQKSHAPQIGRFLKVDPQAALGKASLAQNDTRPIKKDSTLCTYLPFGQIKFVVDPKVTCWLDPGSRVRVYPPTKKGNRDVVVRFEDGDSTWCNTGTATEESKFDANTGKVRLIMRDPLFSVGLDAEKGTIVKVDLGYVEVSKLAGAGAVVVGPGQQTGVPNGGEPGFPGPIQLTAHDNERIADLMPLVVAPNLKPPPSTGSPTLAAIYRAHVIRVAIGSDATAPIAGFARAYFNLLARSWGLKPAFTVGAASADITRGLGRTFDVAVTGDPALVGRLANFPLLEDGAGVVWSALRPADNAFGAALESFLAASVASGDYGDAYRASLPGVEPNYTALHSVLFAG
jgi:hypothetical protein